MQCQIITFLILKSDNISKSRIDLKKYFYQIKNKRYIYNHLTLPLGTFVIYIYFLLFHVKIEEKKMWVDYWGEGGGKGYVGTIGVGRGRGGGAGGPAAFSSPMSFSSHAYGTKYRST